MRPLFYFLLIITSFGCSDSDLPDYYRLDRLRVLALIADQPETSPGGSVSITPVVSDLFGGGRALTYSAESCLDPGVGFGATPTCENSSSRVVIASGSTLSGLSAPNYTGTVTSVLSIALPQSAVIFAGRTADEQINGVPYLVTFTVQGVSSSGETDQVRAFRRILVSTRTIKNQNPSFNTGNEILASGAPLLSFPSSETEVQGGVSTGSSESYQESQDGITSSLQESLTLTWFVSDGSVSKTRTESDGTTRLRPPSTAPSGRNYLIGVVLRDGRGGASFFSLAL